MQRRDFIKSLVAGSATIVACKAVDKHLPTKKSNDEFIKPVLKYNGKYLKSNHYCVFATGERTTGFYIYAKGQSVVSKVQDADIVDIYSKYGHEKWRYTNLSDGKGQWNQIGMIDRYPAVVVGKLYNMNLPDYVRRCYGHR